MKLSILTPTIRGRENQLSILLEKIESQITKCGTNQIEHLVLLDNRMRSIGAKRQALVDIARGDFIAFVDDDDDISEMMRTDGEILCPLCLSEITGGC